LKTFTLQTPLIASEESGAEEQLRDAILLIDQKSPEEIPETIYKVSLNPALRKNLLLQAKNVSSDGLLMITCLAYFYC
jgi:trehalose-6-phosphate synthase